MIFAPKLLDKNRFFDLFILFITFFNVDIYNS